MKVCKNCQKEYLRGGKLFCKKCIQKYGSQKLIYIHSRKQKVCELCNTKYTFGGKRRCKECINMYGYTYDRGSGKEKICCICGKLFFTRKVKRAKTCSEKCTKEYKRRYNLQYKKDKQYNKIKEWNKKNKHKMKAASLVCHAKSTGKINKPEKCEVCGKGGRIVGHHENYDYPLEVVWLCTGCHKKLHNSRRGKCI